MPTTERHHFAAQGSVYSTYVPSSDDVALAVLAAVTAGDLANKYFRETLVIRRKSAPGDVVTDVDVAAEEAVRQILVRERPDDGILGEEGAHAEGTRRWLIDAIDGTLNFVRGDPFWCSAVAMEDSDGGGASAIYHPYSGEIFKAVRGVGCWLNDQPLKMDQGGDLANSVLATFVHAGDGKRLTFARILDAIASPRIRGSGSLELAWLAAGRIDAWVQRNVKPWDLVPGALIVTEAGGVCETLEASDGSWSFASSVGPATDLRNLIRG